MARGKLPLAGDEIFVSYAQNFEDVMLWRALGHVRQGFYIDIGAQDPSVDSVSRAFHERGWQGMHVEPTSAYARLLREARPDDQVLEVAVADRDGLLELFEFPHTGLSTADDAIAAQHADAGFAAVRITVPCITMDTLLAPFVDRDVHWLKIDVEGFESRVLRGWSSAAARPWVVVVESTMPLSDRETSSEWQDGLLALGYEHVYFDGLNRFYVSERHRELGPAFSRPPNVFDGFELSGESSFGLGLRRRIRELEGQRAAEAAESSAARDRIHDLETIARNQLDQLRSAREDVEQARASLAEAQARIDADARKIGSLEGRLDLLEELLATLRTDHQQAVARAAASQTRLAHVEHELAQRDALCRNLDQLYRSVIQSRSWRFAAPLRWVANRIRGLDRALRSGLARAVPATRAIMDEGVRRGLDHLRAHPDRMAGISSVVRRIPPLDARLRALAARHRPAESAAPRSVASPVTPNGASATLLARRLDYVTELETRLDDLAAAHRREIERLTRELDELRATGRPAAAPREFDGAA